MNLTDEQKKYLVPASIAATVFVLCDELVFKAKGKRPGKPSQKTLLAAGASAVASYFFYDKTDAATKATLTEYALPAGGASVAFAAVNRFAPITGNRRPYALGAAAVGAWLTNKETSSTPIVGLLPVYEPPFDPVFEPPFPPQYEG